MWGNLAKSALEATTGQTPSKLLQRIENVVAPRENDYDDDDDSQDESEDYETDSDYEDDDEDDDDDDDDGDGEVRVYGNEMEYYEEDNGGDYEEDEVEKQPRSLLGGVWNSAKKGLIATSIAATSSENQIPTSSTYSLQKESDRHQQHQQTDDTWQHQDDLDFKDREVSTTNGLSSHSSNENISSSSLAIINADDERSTQDQKRITEHPKKLDDDFITLQEESNFAEEESTSKINNENKLPMHVVDNTSINDNQIIDMTPHQSSKMKNNNLDEKFETKHNEYNNDKTLLTVKDKNDQNKDINYESFQKNVGGHTLEDATDEKKEKMDPPVIIPNHTLLKNVFSTTVSQETSVIGSDDMFSTRTTLAEEDDVREEILSVSEFLPPALFVLCDVDDDMIPAWLKNQYDPSLFELILLPSTTQFSTLCCQESIETIQSQGKVGIYYCSDLSTKMQVQKNLPQWESFRYITITNDINDDFSGGKNSNIFELKVSENNDWNCTLRKLASKLQDWYPQLSSNKSTLSLSNSANTVRATKCDKKLSEELPPIVICGPSGVGKGTLIDKIMKQFPDQFGFSVSHTTRTPRAGEIDKVHYNFTTVDVMKSDVAQNLFIEHAIVHGHYYGTSLSAVQSVQKNGKICILDIDAQGVANVKKSMLHPYYIFISPPSMEALENRLRGRGTDSEESILKRLENSKKELEYGNKKGNFDRVFINDDLNNTFQALITQIMQWYPDLKGEQHNSVCDLSENTTIEQDSDASYSSNIMDATVKNDNSETSILGDALSNKIDKSDNSKGLDNSIDYEEFNALRSELKVSRTTIFELEQQIKKSVQQKNDTDRLQQMEEKFIKMQQSMQMQIGELQHHLAKEQRLRLNEEKSFQKNLKQANARSDNTENMIQDLRIKYEKESSDTENRYESQIKHLDTNLSRTKVILSEKEEEVHQLQVIVGDLRKMIKDNQEGVDAAEEEADELHEENEKLHKQLEKKQKEIESSKKEISRLQSENSKMLGLHMEVRMLEETLERDKRKMESVSHSLTDESAKISQERDTAKASVVDLKQQLDALHADMNILKADYSRAISANANLQTALEAFQNERDAEIVLFKEQKASAEEANNLACEAKIEAARLINQKAIDEVQTAANNAVKNMMDELQSMEHNLEDQRKESINLRRSLDEAISRLQRTQEDVIDRSLMRNILLDWHSKKGKARRDVLELMASVLHFSQDEKDRCDIGENTGAYRKVVDAVAPPISPAKIDPASLAGGNMREKWVSFLLSECGDESIDDPKEQEK